jgi:hypothetical protein
VAHHPESERRSAIGRDGERYGRRDRLGGRRSASPWTTLAVTGSPASCCTCASGGVGGACWMLSCCGVQLPRSSTARRAG